MSQLGGNDSKMVRYLVLFAAVVALAVGGLIFTSMRDAGEKEGQLEQRLSDKYGQDIEVRKDVEGGRHPDAGHHRHHRRHRSRRLRGHRPGVRPVPGLRRGPEAHAGRIVATR